MSEIQDLAANIDALLVSRYQSMTPQYVLLKAADRRAADGIQQYTELNPPNRVYSFKPPADYMTGFIVPALRIDTRLIPVWPIAYGNS